MLQQALKVSGRSASPLIKWMEKWAETTAGLKKTEAAHGMKTLKEMPGPTVAKFAWDLFAKRGLSRLHELQVNYFDDLFIFFLFSHDFLYIKAR